ncbi:MAG: NAD(P)-dependent oxidoreductase [Acidimicrobiales bacterium]
MMRILYADDIDESRLVALRAAGHDCLVDASLNAETLVDAVPGYDVLVVRSTTVTAEAIAAGGQLGLIIRAGAGTDNIDKTAASARGVFVCNVPGRNAIAVAELTMGLLLAVDRRIADNTSDLRQGRWNKSTYTEADGLFGKRLGIIGLGDIGLAVAERAKAFGLSVSAQRKPDRSPRVQAAIRSIGIRMIESQEALLAESDVISLHVPKSEDTTGLVDAAFLARLPEGAVLLNTSRGDVVDEPALLDALDRGVIRAGLDVWAGEPSSGSGSFDSALARHPRVVGTHHIGASTAQAQRSVSDGTVEAIEAYIAGSPIDCVNLRSQPSGTCSVNIRHLDRVGVLAKIFAVLRTNGLNVQQMQNQVFEGGEAAVATINISLSPTQEVVDAILAIDEVFNVVVIPQQ